MPSYRVRASATGVLVVASLVASLSVLTIGLDSGLPAAPAVAHADPVGSAAPSGSLLAR